MKTFELRLIPYELHAAIKAAAFREGVSMNKWILKALKQAISSTKEDDHKSKSGGKKLETGATETD